MLYAEWLPTMRSKQIPKRNRQIYCDIAIELGLGGAIGAAIVRNYSGIYYVWFRIHLF